MTSGLTRLTIVLNWNKGIVYVILFVTVSYLLKKYILKNFLDKSLQISFTSLHSRFL